MKITFILPGIGKKSGEGYIGTWKMEPLTIATLSALTPSSVEREFFDDRLESICFETKTDLVVLSVETYTAKRAYDIAARFRQRGVPVLMGGYHPTLMPEESSNYADSVMTGNAEVVWAEMLEDLKNGHLKPLYQGNVEFSNLLPDRSLFNGRKYIPLTLVETGRGCPFKCEFCAISSYYCSRYKPRPIADVVAEIRQSGGRYFFLVDDNIVADPEHAKKLFRALKPLNIKWTSQGSLTMARDQELLTLMKESGCMTILIGFESLNNENLEQMNKAWNARLGERDTLVQNIHDAGIGIYATFVFGFDSDTDQDFKNALTFSQKHGFFFVAFNHLLPFPGTALHHRLLAEDRLLTKDWWLHEGYKYGDIPYQPIAMTPEVLSQSCTLSRRAFYTWRSILKRGIQQFLRNKDLFLLAVFFSQNARLRIEVDGKNHIPIGQGLDESIR